MNTDPPAPRLAQGGGDAAPPGVLLPPVNNNTTTQGAAGLAAGTALAASTMIIWVLSLFGVAVPNEVATAMVTLLTVGSHAVGVLIFKPPPAPPPAQNLLPAGDPA